MATLRTVRKRRHHEFQDTSEDESESCAFQDSQFNIFESQPAHQLCTRCASADFNITLPKEGWVRVLSLGMLSDFVQEPKCSLCQLFGSQATLIAANPLPESNAERIYINYSLYAFSSFAIFGTSRNAPRGLLETKLFGILGEYGYTHEYATLFGSPHQPTNFGTKHMLPERSSISKNRLSRISGQYSLGNGYHFDMSLIKCAGYLAPMPMSVPSQNLEHSFTGRRINPESIDVLAVMKGFDFCQCYHRSSCGIRQQKTLSGVKVIDCKSRKVIPAPLCCQYVALSYVW